MLTNVHLQNLALIREADIDFETGLNIMTGETGAGKSVIIGSINMALGEKANKAFIRTGSDSALVELSFTYTDPCISERLSEIDIPSDQNSIIITRKLTKDTSSCRINGRTVTLNDLKEITSMLVDIHGQHDNQTLLHPSRHLEIVDEFGSSDIRSVKSEFHDNYMLYKSIRSRIRSFSEDPEELSKEESFLAFCINEIDEAALVPGEDASLENEYKELSNAERITQSLAKIHSDLFDSASGASNHFADAIREISALTALAPKLASYTDVLMDIDALARDLDYDLLRYIEENGFDEKRYDEIRQRLDLINKLKSKYGSSIPDILEYRNTCEKRLSQISSYAKNRSALQARLESIRADINKQAALLSQLRKEAALKLEQKITANLQDLNFLNVDFQIEFSKADKIYEYGFDRAQFMISTNVGEPRKPLLKVASGGELSRIMLAIKASIADADSTQTLIFDEIDTGISGRTAQKVAEKLALLSKSHQLICITHLPQIAAMADVHFSIEKSVNDGSTLSGIHRLTLDDSIAEIARLISGSEITPVSLRSAAEMKALAQDLK